MLAFLQGLSPWHLLLVGAIALLFYGNRLPEVARSLGKAVNEFKRGLKDVQDEISKDADDARSDPPRKLDAPTSNERLQSTDAEKPAEDAEHAEQRRTETTKSEDR